MSVDDLAVGSIMYYNKTNYGNEDVCGLHFTIYTNEDAGCLYYVLYLYRQE